VAATRTTGPALDAQTYAELAKPSRAVTPFSYRAVAPDLFKGVVSSLSAAEHASRCVSPTSQRAEK
jgi:cytochrome o ubiquinol oxidase subunit 2